MDRALHDNELQLGRFAEYLLRQRLVPEKNAPYHVSWVRRFISRGVTVLASRVVQRAANRPYPAPVP